MGARHVERHRQIVGHRQLDGQPAGGSSFGRLNRKLRRHERVHDELRGEERAAQPGQHRRRHRHHRGREEEEHRVQIQEVAVPDRSPSPAPRVREEDEQDERGRREAQERQHPPRVEPPAREKPQRDCHTPREEVRHEAEMTPDEEVLDIVREAIRELRRVEHVVGVRIVRGHLDALAGLGELLPGVLRRVERKARVEGPAVAPLVVELAGAEGRDTEQPGHGHAEDDADDQPGRVSPAHPEQQHGRADEQDVEGLRERRHPEQDGCKNIAPEPARRRLTVGPRRFLVKPGEVAEEDQREVEQVRRHEDAVDGHHGRADERQRERKRRGRTRPSRQKDVPAHADAEQQQDVEDEEAVQAEQPHERRHDDRVDQRLAEIQPVGVRIRRPVDVHEGRGPVDAHAQPLAALQEDAVGPPAVQSPISLEIPPLVREIMVEGHAERHRDVGRFVSLDAEAGLDDINGNRRGERDDEEDGGRPPNAGAPSR